MRNSFLSLFSLFILASQPLAVAATSGVPPEVQAMFQDYQQQAVIERFYTAFQNNDGPAMIACYHPQVTFNDPVFGTLQGREAKGMWLMLLEAGKGNLKISHHHVGVLQGVGQADWDAYYVFSATGNPVTNHIHGKFAFKDGLISNHQDTFDLYTWSSMALGPFGALLGHTPFVQEKIRSNARAALDAYLKQHPEIK